MVRTKTFIFGNRLLLSITLRGGKKEMVVVGGRGLVGYGKYDLKLFLADVLNICSTAAFAHILQVRIVKNQTHLKYHLNSNI